MESKQTQGNKNFDNKSVLHPLLVRFFIFIIRSTVQGSIVIVQTFFIPNFYKSVLKAPLSQKKLFS